MSRIKVDRITDKAGTGAPILVNGMNVTGKSTMGDIVGAAVTFNSITGGSANFSSDVSIGGTLTYEDVKNVDSVGLITARSGVDITAGDLNAASNLILKVDGTERVRVTSAGKLLLGTTTEGQANADDLTIAGAAHAGITVRSGTSNNGSVFFSDGTSGVDEYRGWLQYTHTSDYLTFGTNASEKLRIGSVGQIGLSGANYGTSGQVITSQGSGAAPQWTTPAAAGAWTLLQSASNPNTSTVDFVGLTTSYAAYKVQFIGANINSTNQRTMRCRVFLNGTLATGSGDYRQQTMYMTYTSSSYNGSGTSRDCIALSGTNQISKGYNGELTFPMKLRTSGGAESLQAYYGTVVSQSYTNFVSGFMETSFSTLLTGIRFDSPDNYNVTDGQFYLYGLART